MDVLVGGRTGWFAAAADPAAGLAAGIFNFRRYRYFGQFVWGERMMKRSSGPRRSQLGAGMAFKGHDVAGRRICLVGDGPWGG